VANIFSMIILVFPLHTKMCQFTCTKQKAPDNSEVKRSLQHCGVTPTFLENLWTPPVTLLTYLILDIGNSHNAGLTNNFLTCSAQKFYHPEIPIICIVMPSPVELLETYLTIRMQ
jgi:hypothetical protein